MYFPDLNPFNLESLSQLVIEHGPSLKRNKWVVTVVSVRLFQMLLLYVNHKEGSESPLFVKCFMTPFPFGVCKNTAADFFFVLLA